MYVAAFLVTDCFAIIIGNNHSIRVATLIVVLTIFSKYVHIQISCQVPLILLALYLILSMTIDV